MSSDSEEKSGGDTPKRHDEMSELLTELRVAVTGVQILFAFLLTVPFSARWNQIPVFEKTVYYITLLTSLASAVFLISPSAMHRFHFDREHRKYLMAAANRRMIAGLTFLAFSLVGAVLMISDVVFKGAFVWVFPCALFALVFWLWFAQPASQRARGVTKKL